MRRQGLTIMDLTTLAVLSIRTGTTVLVKLPGPDTKASGPYRRKRQHTRRALLGNPDDLGRHPDSAVVAAVLAPGAQG